MGRFIQQYTDAKMRWGIWEGTFLETNDINVGDHILTHHICMYSKRPMLQKVIRKETAYHINGTPVYDFIVEGGSSYKSNLKLVSIYDPLIGECDMETEQPYNFQPIKDMTVEQMYYERERIKNIFMNREAEKRAIELYNEINKRTIPQKF